MELLNAQTQEIEVSPADSRLVRTVEWLLGVEASGAWGRDSVAATALVSIALTDFVVGKTSAPGLDQRAAAALDRASIFLDKAYEKNQYEGALWDTCVAGRALLRIPRSSKHLSDITRWILAYRPEAVNAGPHHLAQRSLFLADRGSSSDIVRASVAAVRERVEAADFDFSPYVLGQCLGAVALQQGAPQQDEYVSRLRNYLRTAVLDSANFINVCAALHGLSAIKDTQITQELRLTVASLFGETCFRDDGTWYHDDLCTAWALIALSGYSREIVIRGPKNEILFDVDRKLVKARDEVAAAARDRDSTWSVYVALAFVVGVGIALFATYTTLEEPLPEWLTWLITGVLGAGVVLVASFLARIWRARNDGTSRRN